MTKKTNSSTIAVKTSIQDMSQLKLNTNKKWHKKLIKFVEFSLKKITKTPINITTDENTIMLNASAVFWYQDQECKKFVMIKSNFEDNDTVIQFPFISSFTKDSVSMTLENSIKDLFGKAFSKSLPMDCFAADKITSAPTVIIADEDNKNQTVLHNMVWLHQITQDQALLIKDDAQEFDVVSLPEYQLTDYEVHEVHKFIYQSCIRHIHSIKHAEEFRVNESLEDAGYKSGSEKILH